MFTTMILWSQTLWPVTYPTQNMKSVNRYGEYNKNISTAYKGESTRNYKYNQDVYVPLKESPLIRVSSDTKKQSYGGGRITESNNYRTQSYESACGQSNTTNATFNAGSSFFIPRMKSISEGSVFVSTATPSLSNGQTPIMFNDPAPPPPDDPDPSVDDQLPIGNGLWIMLLFVGMFMLIRRFQISEFRI